MSTEPLGELEHQILLVILRLGPDSYGVSIIDELRRHTNRRVLAPSVYLALRRLEAKGLIRSRLGEPEARRGGRARRHFALAPGAKARLRESQAALMRLWQGVTFGRGDGS